MRTHIYIGAILSIIIMSGCGKPSSEPESPQKALQTIIQLYETQDFDTLVRSRYAELGKAENEEQVQTIIDRLKGRFSDEQRRNQAIAIYKSLLTISPEMSENGTVAIYKMDQGFVKLSRMQDGKWGFHL